MRVSWRVGEKKLRNTYDNMLNACINFKNKIISKTTDKVFLKRKLHRIIKLFFHDFKFKKLNLVVFSCLQLQIWITKIKNVSNFLRNLLKIFYNV